MAQAKEAPSNLIDENGSMTGLEGDENGAATKKCQWADPERDCA
jgi:hypothetical protein